MSKRILLIDSDESFAQELQAAILASGFSAVSATDSEQGMALAREDLPDLIVVCVEAQPTNGYMICTRLKKDDALKGIPVILTSSNATEESFEKHKKLKTRAEEYLIKPFAPGLLLQKASALLGVDLPAHAEEPLEDEIVSMEDEPLGLGDLVADEDEPIRLSDSEAAAAHEPEAEILEDSVEVEIEEEQPQNEAPVSQHPDDDLQLFDRAFEAIGMPGEEPASAPPARSSPPRSRPAAPRAVPEPRAAEQAGEDTADDELAFAALDALDDSRQQAVLEDPAEAEPEPARPSPARSAPARQNPRSSSPDDAPPSRRTAEAPDGGAQARKAEKEVARLKEELETRERELGDLQAHAEELREEATRHQTAAQEAQKRADALGAAAKKFDRELSELREQLDAATGEKELLSEEREELRQKLSAAEAEAARNEERAVKAYQKMKGDERLREKTRKALQVALQLLEEGTGAAEGREAPVAEKQSA